MSFRSACLTVLLGAGLLVHFAGLARAQSPDDANATKAAGNCQHIRYSTNPQYPPYDWQVGDKEFDGASIELLKMVIPEGITLTPVVVPWPRALRMAEQGDVDLLVSLRITPERSRYLQFTTHRAFPNPIAVFVCEEHVFAYTGWADLVGKRGGISRGDTFGGGFDEYWRANLQIEEAPSMEENFRKLDAGRIDYFVTSLYLGQAYAARQQREHTIKALEPLISTQDIYFGFSRLSECAGLVARVSENLKSLDEKGVPEQLLKTYLQRVKLQNIKSSF